jgi:signal peptidase I
MEATATVRGATSVAPPRMVSSGEAPAELADSPACSLGCHALVGARFDPHTGFRVRRPGQPGPLAVAGELAVKAALAASLAALLAVGILPRFGWYRTETALSGSMKPYFSPGDMLVLTPAPLRHVRRGWVISYQIPLGDHHVQTHRVVQVVRGGDHPLVRTKGDANNGADPWVAEMHGSTVWRVRAVVPHAGQVIVWLRTPLVHYLTLFAAPFLLALLLIVRIWRDPEKPADGDDSPETSADALPV